MSEIDGERAPATTRAARDTDRGARILAQPRGRAAQALVRHPEFLGEARVAHPVPWIAAETRTEGRGLPRILEHRATEWARGRIPIDMLALALGAPDIRHAALEETLAGSKDDGNGLSRD